MGEPLQGFSLHPGRRIRDVEAMNYIYALINPDKQVFYVGKSHDPKRRMNEHRRVLGYRPEYIILEQCGDQWREAEQRWIEHYHLVGANLINRMVAGSGCESLSAESRRKISEAQKGKPKPDGFGEKLSAVSKGQPRNWSPEGEARVKSTQFRAGDNPLDRMSEDGRRRFKEAQARRLKEVPPEVRSERSKRIWAEADPEARKQRCLNISAALKNSERLKAASRTPERRAACARGWAASMAKLTQEQREARIERYRANMREVQKKRRTKKDQPTC